MKQKKYTKRALCMSLLSMLLCCSMLIGTTFAWFTDSVTSGRNKIVAGNLDVELYHTGADGVEKPVTTDTALFTDAKGNKILWEPGVAVYENFRVENVGTLALKFRLAMNVFEKNTVTVSGKTYSLADVIKVAVVKGTFSGSREEAQKLDFSTGLEAFERFGTLQAKEAGATDAPSTSFAVVLYWEPTENDNIYNLNNGKRANDGTDQLYIELGIDLQATQTPHESDSFGDDYDATAEFPDAAFSIGPASFTGTPEAGQPTELGNGAITVTVPEDAVATGEEIVLEVTPADHVAEGVTVNADEQVVSYDIGLYKESDHSEVHPTKPVHVLLFLGKNLTDVTVYHNGERMETGVSYDSETGYLTFDTSSFSPFDIVYHLPIAQLTTANGDTELIGTVAALDAAVAQASTGDVITLVRDVVVTSTSNHASVQTNVGSINSAIGTLKDGAVFDGNDHTITMLCDNTGLETIFADIYHATLKNLNVVLGGAVSVVYNASYATYEDVTVSGSAVFGNNQGVFVLYANQGPVSFTNCVSEVNINGEKASYCAVFVGYPLQADLSFTDCVNRGDLTAQKAAMFAANPGGSWKQNYDFTVTNCKNEGHIKNLDTTQFGPANLFYAVSSGDNFKTKTNFTIDGTAYTSAELLALDTEQAGLGNPVEVAMTDHSLEVKLTDDRTGFLIIPASELDVARYVLSYDTMANTGDGYSTMRQSLTWEFTAEKGGDAVTAKIKNWYFVDQEWINTHPNAQKAVDELGNSYYTYGNYTYYELPDLANGFYRSHEPNPGDFVSVMAYDANGRMICTVGFEITRGETSSKK